MGAGQEWRSKWGILIRDYGREEGCPDVARNFGNRRSPFLGFFKKIASLISENGMFGPPGNKYATPPAAIFLFTKGCGGFAKFRDTSAGGSALIPPGSFGDHRPPIAY